MIIYTSQFRQRFASAVGNRSLNPGEQMHIYLILTTNTVSTNERFIRRRTDKTWTVKLTAENWQTLN